jgi:hypothetical protein
MLLMGVAAAVSVLSIAIVVVSIIDMDRNKANKG